MLIKQLMQLISLCYFSMWPIATNSYFKDRKGQEQLKAKTGVGATVWAHF